MKEISIENLKRMLWLAAEKIEENKKEIDKINVFPVPDQDTGTNLAITLKGIKEAIEKKDFKNFDEFQKTVLESALISAQGNAGVIFVGFLSGFLPKLSKNPINAQALSEAFLEGKKRAFRSIINPKEGTILDVIEATASAFEKESKRKENIIDLFKEAIEKAKDALLKTREKLEILKKANVVDAGGLGFLMILESFLEALEGKKRKGKKELLKETKKFIQVLKNRYEIVALILNPKDSEKIREKLEKLGDCLDIVQIGNKMKIHIHTDYPEEVREVLKKVGKIENLKIEDMAKEIIGQPSLKEVSIGLVTENAASLSPKIIEKYQIEIANTIFEWPELEKIPGENIYQKIKKAYEMGIESRPKTSQPPPGDYLRAYQRQLQKFEKVLCLTVSSKISGCFNSAIQAKEMLTEKERERVFVFDTLNAAAGQALFVLKAIELIQEKREIFEILEELKKLLLKTKTYFVLADPKGLEFIGRITKSQANWIKRMKRFKIQPIIEFKNGILKKGGIVFAKDEAEALFKKIKKVSKKKKIRVVINHTGNFKEAQKLKDLLKKIGAEVSFISEGPPIFCAVTGPGTLISAFQPIE